MQIGEYNVSFSVMMGLLSAMITSGTIPSQHF